MMQFPCARAAAPAAVRVTLLVVGLALAGAAVVPALAAEPAKASSPAAALPGPAPTLPPAAQPAVVPPVVPPVAAVPPVPLTAPAGAVAAAEGTSAPAVSPPPAIPAASSTKLVDNPYGLQALWQQGDAISRGTLGLLLLMSAASWYILVTKLFEQSRLLLQGRRANRRLWQAASLDEGIEALSRRSPFRHLALVGQQALARHQGVLVERIDLNSWVAQSLQRAIEGVVGRLQGGLSILATVASTAPFVGLFGTVWGIHHALITIGISGQATIDRVAGPVGEALIMTALGLVVAVPAVIGHNALVRRNKVASEAVRAVAGELQTRLLSGGRLAPSTSRAAA